jgi:hypothetical protein
MPKSIKSYYTGLIKPRSFGEGHGVRQPFAFCLSAFTPIAAFCFLLSALSFGCSPHPNLQGKGEAYLQGDWRQDSVPEQKKLLEYSLYRISFSCDSFYMQIKSFSRVNNGADTCMRSGHWTEYVKGAYVQHNDTLHMRGQFCHANYSLKEEGGCFRSGIYEECFKTKKQGDSVIQLFASSSVIPIEAHLIKRTTCTQKPL